VAEETYANGNIQETVEDLPCFLPCPPPAASTNPLRQVLLRWAGETCAPPKTVLCTPSKSMEAWVVAALFPQDKAALNGIECWPHPVNRLAQQPASQRIQKRTEDYEKHFAELKDAWPGLAANLSEAQRFQSEFLAIVPREGHVAAGESGCHNGRRKNPPSWHISPQCAKCGTPWRAQTRDAFRPPRTPVLKMTPLFLRVRLT